MPFLSGFHSIFFPLRLRAGLLPQAKPTDEGSRVVAQPRARRELLQQFGVSASEYDVIYIERCIELYHNFSNISTPLLLAQTLKSADSQIIFESKALLVMQLSDFHRFQQTIDNHRGPQAGAQPEKKHSSALVDAKSLHGRVIQDLDGPAERFLEVESYPPASQVVRVAQWTTMDDWPGIPD